MYVFLLQVEGQKFLTENSASVYIEKVRIVSVHCLLHSCRIVSFSCGCFLMLRPQWGYGYVCDWTQGERETYIHARNKTMLPSCAPDMLER
jgi:hypothetical protein